jgi:hypothetical protein
MISDAADMPRSVICLPSHDEHRAGGQRQHRAEAKGPARLVTTAARR